MSTAAPAMLAAAITSARDADILRADHFLHLRCEIPMPDVVEEAKELIDRPDVRLMSLMDHTPGQRQFRDEVKLRDYYRGKGGGMTDAELDVLFKRRFDYQQAYAAKNMRAIVALAHQHEIPLASHDDTTDENVTDAIRDRVAVAEFPTTMEAARGLHQAGIDILMGAPNVVRGGSHSGNIAAVDLAREGLLDILSSDYMPSSLLMGALQLPQAGAGDRSCRRGAHRDQDAGRSRRPRRSRRDRGRQARRPDPRPCRGRHAGGAQRLAGRAPGRMSEALTVSAGTADAIGPGRLVLVVGPSGAGKDTLLGSGARRPAPKIANIVFPRRVVTREASAAEDNDALSADDFRQALRAWRFCDALGGAWPSLRPAAGDRRRHPRRPHGRGQRLAHGDRSAARRAYANVVVVAITAPPEVLAERIAMRGARQRRQYRAAAGPHRRRCTAAPDVTILNVGSAEDHARQLVRVIRGECWHE